MENIRDKFISQHNLFQNQFFQLRRKIDPVNRILIHDKFESKNILGQMPDIRELITWLFKF